MKKINIVIPVYNSDDCLENLWTQITDALKETSFEVIFVNDCSSDNSWSKIRDLALQNKDITSINLRKNSGQDNAIMAGIEECDGEYIIIMDDDLQHSPYDILKLVEGCENGADISYGKFTSLKAPFWKKIGSWFNGKVAEVILNKPKNLYLSPFKAVKGDIIKEVLNYQGIYPYVDGILLSVTNYVTEISVEHHSRYQGSSGYNITKSLKVWVKLLTGFSVIPLRFATVIGIFTAFCGFVLGLYYYYRYLVADIQIEGWTTLVLVILFLGGTTLISLGAIGEYVGRIYLNTNSKTSYSVKEKIKKSN